MVCEGLGSVGRRVMVKVVTFSICAKERKMELRVPLTDDLMLWLHRTCVCAPTEGDLQAL